MNSVKKYQFEDYLERANAAGSVEALFKVFVDTVKLHGLDRAIFSLSTEHNDIDVAAQLGIIHNYPRDWLDYYFQNGFDRIDPVLIHAANKVGMFEWSEIPRYLELRKKQRLCLNLGEEAGLHNGLGILMRGPRNQTAGIALATVEKKDAFDGNLDLVSAYCHHFYVRFKRLNERPAPAGPNIFLTDKERDVLSMVLHGKERRHDRRQAEHERSYRRLAHAENLQEAGGEQPHDGGRQSADPGPDPPLKYETS